jgi:NADH:ubiquinone reductase (non-electrogenic)
MPKPTLAIIGSGWAGFPIAQAVSLARYNVHVISPVRTIQYTPLLASAACGLFDFRLAEEPVRRCSRSDLSYHKATAEKIDFDKRVITCRPSVSDLNWASETFEITYDKLVLAVGCGVQTFGTPGALEHALFLKTTNDARLLQQRFLEMLDAASLPNLTTQQQKDMLNIRVIGGGAIGIEGAAELYDLWNESMQYLYPHLKGKVNIIIHDVAPTLLSTFDESLGEYAMESLREKNIDSKLDTINVPSIMPSTNSAPSVMTSSHIERVERDAIYTKEDGKLPYGLLLWSTGNSANSLVEELDVKKPEKGMPRILTDKYLRILRPDGSSIKEAFAAGDAADIDGNSMPTLAEVALQKGEYLARELNKGDDVAMTPFQYKQKATLAYLGQQDGVIGGKTEWTGQSAWLAWRSGSLQWTRSWRRKLMILINWTFIWFNGRDIARK